MKLNLGLLLLVAASAITLSDCKSDDKSPAKSGASGTTKSGTSRRSDDSGESRVNAPDASISAATGGPDGAHDASAEHDAAAPAHDAATPSNAGADGGKPTKPKPAADAGVAGDEVPCDVAAVLESYCVRCHGPTLREGAPFALLTASDFHRDLGGQTAGEAALKRVRDNVRPMPPPPAARPNQTEIDTLAKWVDAGSRAAAKGCKVNDSTAPMDAGSPDAGVVVVAGGHSAPPETDASTPDAGSTPPPAAAGGDWSMFGVDLANSRNNAAETTLTTGNVSELREVWRFNGPSTTSAPAIAGDVIYLPGWDGKVYARQLEDGASVWTTQLPDLIDSSPTVTDQQVFVSDDNGFVHALERSSGKLQWSHSVDSHAETHLWSSPTYIPSASLVVVGVASGEEQTQKITYTFRGSVVGLDAATGNERWRFETASSDKGSGPGVGSWGTATVDESRKLVFIGTGNNYQPPSSEYSDSLLAINYESGQLAWSKQFTENDTFTIYGAQGVDYDIGSTANLISLDGKDYVGIGVKSGFYFLLDRDSGALQWSTMLTAGSQLGGVISASAYADGRIFVASNEFIASRTSVVALDANNGQIAWRYGTSNLTYGGVAHVNGVVFVGTVAGTIVALDGANGNVLWTDNAPNQQPIAGSPTFAHGRLVVPWGYQWTLREGNSGSGGITVYAR